MGPGCRRPFDLSQFDLTAVSLPFAQMQVTCWWGNRGRTDRVQQFCVGRWARFFSPGSTSQDPPLPTSAGLALTSTPVTIEAKLVTVLKALRDMADLTVSNTELLSDKAISLLILFQVFR